VADTYDPSAYSFGIFLQCTTEEEVAAAMQKLMLPIVGLCLDGINVILLRMTNDETEDDHG
jgi:hypothetical protein